MDSHRIILQVVKFTVNQRLPAQNSWRSAARAQGNAKSRWRKLAANVGTVPKRLPFGASPDAEPGGGKPIDTQRAQLEARDEILADASAVNIDQTKGKHLRMFDDLYLSNMTAGAVTKLLPRGGAASPVYLLILPACYASKRSEAK
jgi:hypothetical protein